MLITLISGFSRFKNAHKYLCNNQEKSDAETCLQEKARIQMIYAYYLAIVLFMFFLGWAGIALSYGKIHKEKKEYLLKEKKRIVYYLEQKDQYFDNYIKEAKQYNKEVNEYNNYWYRFNIEDRSEYEIDIEYYTKTN